MARKFTRSKSLRKYVQSSGRGHGRLIVTRFRCNREMAQPATGEAANDAIKESKGKCRTHRKPMCRKGRTAVLVSCSTEKSLEDFNDDFAKSMNRQAKIWELKGRKR